MMNRNTAQAMFGKGLPLVVMTAIVSLPAQAATLAGASSQSELFNFMLNGVTTLPLSTDTATDTHTLVIGGESSVVSVSDATATFQVDPPVAQAQSIGISQGDGPTSYFGSADGTAEALGLFWVEGLFSFDFTSDLELLTSLDDPHYESIWATGSTLFSLYGSESPDSQPVLIDFFSLDGEISSTSFGDALAVGYSSHISLAPEDCNAIEPLACLQQNDGGNTESALAHLTGSYERNFDTPLWITLVKSQFVAAQVQKTPESTSSLSFLLLLAFGGFRFGHKSSARPADPDISVDE